MALNFFFRLRTDDLRLFWAIDDLPRLVYLAAVSIEPMRSCRKTGRAGEPPSSGWVAVCPPLLDYFSDGLLRFLLSHGRKARRGCPAQGLCWGRPETGPTRKRILGMLATDKIFVAGFHMPFPGVG